MYVFLTIFCFFTLLFLGWRFWFFMRNPDRIIPPGNDFLAPADGFVVYVKKVEDGTVPIAIKQRHSIELNELSHYPPLNGASGYLIGIFMTAFSVHHNRVPLGGKVVCQQRTKVGHNLSTARLMTHILLRKTPYEEGCEHLIENERVTLGIQTPCGDYALTQIADKWISHIINQASVGDVLERGALFGMIRFGSQVDVFIPTQMGYTPLIKPGDYVYAGLSSLARTTNP